MFNIVKSQKSIFNTQPVKPIDLETRREQIRIMFISIGSSLGYRIKFSKKEQYENWSENRLVEHMLYWYLDRGLKVGRDRLDKEWTNTDRRKHGVQQFKSHGFVKLFLKDLF